MLSPHIQHNVKNFISSFVDRNADIVLLHHDFKQKPQPTQQLSNSHLTLT